MINLDTNLLNRKFIITKIVTTITKNYNWFIIFSYQSFTYERKLVNKH